MQYRTKASPSRSLAAGNQLEFHETVVHREGNRAPLLGCLHSRRFLEVDEETLEAVEALRREGTIEAAERALEARTGESYDLLELAQRLLDRGFVQAVDGIAVGSEVSAAEQHRNLYRVAPTGLKWMHHPATGVAVGIGILVWLATLFHDPGLLPSFRHIFLFQSPGINIVASFGGFLFFAYLHELAHFFMARSFGIDAKIRVSHRLYLLVLETDVTNAWVLEPRKRLCIFLAGIGFNMTLVSALSLFLWGIEHGHLPYADLAPYLRFVVFVNFFPLFYQLMFFARTDLYYVLLILTGERNLAADARGYIGLRIKRLWRTFRRAPARRCPACRGRAYHDEPFCFQCGDNLPVEDVNRYPFEYASRRRLAVFGVIMYVGMIVGLLYLTLFGSQFLLIQVRAGLTHMLLSIPARNWGLLVEGFLVTLVSALQLLFIFYFLGGDLVRSWVNVVANRRARKSGGFGPVAPVVAGGSVLPEGAVADASGQEAKVQRRPPAAATERAHRRKQRKNKEKRRRRRN